MIKADLVRKISEIYPFMSMKNIDRIVTIMFDTMIRALQDNRRIEIRGFGSFWVKARLAALRRNPKTGKKVTVGDRMVPFFKAGKQLKEQINAEPVR